MFYQLCESKVLDSLYNSFAAVSMLAEKRIIEVDPTIEISRDSLPNIIELLEPQWNSRRDLLRTSSMGDALIRRIHSVREVL